VNYYKRHIGDYAAKAGHLSPLEHGVYTLLIDAYYNREEAPTRAEAIRWARARSSDELAAVDAVLGEFFTEQDGRFTQSRIEEELATFRVKQEVNRQLGARGGQAKAKRIASESLSENVAKQVTDRLANAKPSHKPLAISQEEEKKPRTKGKASEVTLTEWIDGLDGADAIPADDPLFAWAKTTGIPRDWIALAWWGFEARYADNAKTYADWRQVFRRAVREDWLKLWRNGRDGWELTTAGVALQREMRS
jgi:uncharacterized protein YdaU (DUF1376 family)